MCKCSKQNLVFVNSLDDEREQKVFNIISEEPANFTTIKNKTGLHQEIISRILDRLKGRVIVRKTDGFYDLCCNGSKLKEGGKNGKKENKRRN